MDHKIFKKGRTYFITFLPSKYNNRTINNVVISPSEDWSLNDLFKSGGGFYPQSVILFFKEV